jgi:hypothetical protein
MAHSPRSPWKPWTIYDGDGTQRVYCRCFRCERFLGARTTARELTYVAPGNGLGLRPGWYCPHCLDGSRRCDP